MKKVALWIFFQFVFAGFVYAQALGFTKPPEIDTNYVRGTWDTWSLRLFTSRKTNQFSIRSKQTDTSIRYVPNKIWVVGVGIAYKYLLLDVGFAIPIPGESTKRFDAKLSFRLGNDIIEFGYQRYQGFEAFDNLGGKYDYRADVRSQLFGIDYYRNFATRKVPFRDLATGLQVQKKSAGTFGFGGYWAWDKLKVDSSVIPKNLDEFFNDDARVQFSSQISLGVLAGYAYSLVLPKNFFLFASLLPGFGINTGRIEAVSTYNPPLVPTGKINARAAFGYIGKGRLYVILSGTSETTITSWGRNTRYSYSIAQLKLAVGYRFISEIGFLERAAKRLQEVQFK